MSTGDDILASDLGRHENFAPKADDPFALFGEWLADAEKSEPNDANAMSVATVDADGLPECPHGAAERAFAEAGFRVLHQL